MKKIYLVLMGLLTVMTAWAGSSTDTEGADNNRDVAYNYTFDSETGELALLYGEFSKDDKWGDDVDPSSVLSVTATGAVSFVGDCTGLFSGFSNCTSMELNNVFTGDVNNMKSMFEGCSSLTTLEISNWNTYNVTDMSRMFTDCKKIRSLNLSGWETDNVTDMSWMFANCERINSLNVTNWNTENVTDMNHMFYNLNWLHALDLSDFNTSNVTDMNNMFHYSKFHSLDLSNFNTSNVRVMEEMFTYCNELTTINIAGWVISNNLSSMRQMFQGCDHLYTIYASTSWDATHVTSYNSGYMFTYCSSLVGGCGTTYDPTIVNKTYARIDRGTDEPGYFTGVFSLSLPDNVTASPDPVCTIGGTGYYKAGITVTLNYNGEVPQGKMVIYRVNGTQIEGNTFQMPLDNVTVTYEIKAMPLCYTFNSETGALTLVSGEFNKDNKWGSEVVANAVTSVTATNQVSFVGDCTELFSGFSNCTSMDLSNVSTIEVTNMTDMFYDCQNLTSLDLSSWNTSKVTKMVYMFYNCKNLKSLNLSGWDLAQPPSLISMFRDCDKLTTIYVSTSWDTENINANLTVSMFGHCRSLVGGCGTTFDSNYTDKTYARIDRGTEQPGYLTGVFTLTLPQDVTASPDPVCTLGGADYYATGDTVTLTYNGEVPEGKIVSYSVNGIQIEGNTFQMPLNDVTVTFSLIYPPIKVTVGDITFNMIKVDGNNEISTYYIGECEVTEALWQAVMGENPSSFQGNLADNLPVENISWNDCQAFLAKLNEMTKLDFRLPTSAEWLFAASGGNDTQGYTYSGSNTVNEVAWYNGNCSQKMTVGTKNPNELGIYDMSGNLYEIIQEATGVYGGGWHSPANRCKVGYYWTANEDFADNDTGFRLAITNFHKTPEVVTVGDITFNMIKVDGNDEISTYYIGECEVTEALWQAVMGENPSSFQGNLADKLPVENISWNDCQAFLAKLKEMTKLDFRLPTSTEWLFAASGGNYSQGFTYSGSNTIGDVAWYRGNCIQKKTVGTKAPNELGIHDMSGNVYEITQEATEIYGGGWHSTASNCAISYYWSADEDFSDNDTGFRIALTNFDEIPAVLGDVNCDGSVTVADVTCIYNYLLSGDVSYIDTCDVDGDGSITAGDITVIYNILLGNKK